MRHLLVATHNAHKTAEIAAVLGREFAVTDLNAHPEVEPIEETGSTFLENARLKAVTTSRRFPGVVLADDSGLEVDVLDGAPGIRSARYAGERGHDAANRKKLLRALEAVDAGKEARSARFHCVMALAKEGELLGIFEGTIDGTIIDEERGNAGFGYDALFVPHGYRETFGELSPDVKNRISHRARALAKLRSQLAELC